MQLKVFAALTSVLALHAFAASIEERRGEPLTRYLWTCVTPLGDECTGHEYQLNTCTEIPGGASQNITSVEIDFDVQCTVYVNPHCLVSLPQSALTINGGNTILPSAFGGHGFDSFRCSSTSS